MKKRKDSEVRLEYIRISFGALFFAANRVETLADRHLSKYGLSAKQFFLSLVLIQAEKRDAVLSLGDAAEQLGTSRQNVKQLALKLEKKGFCRIEADPKDRRILRILPTGKNIQFWDTIDSENISFLEDVFKSMKTEELNSLASGLKRLLETV